MNNQSVHVTANFRPNSMIYNHNKRVKKFCKREKNIDLSHYHEIIIDSGDVNVFFNKIFEKAVVEYNSNQKRSDRRIKNNDYLSYIKNKNFKSNHRSLKSDGKIKPVTEIEFKIGCRDNQWPNRKQIYAFINSSSISFGAKPVWEFTTLPSFMRQRVGMLITPNWVASSSCSSTFTLQTLISSCSSAICATTGPSILQGPHQGAQKSSKTGLSLFTTSAS